MVPSLSRQRFASLKYSSLSLQFVLPTLTFNFFSMIVAKLQMSSYEVVVISASLTEVRRSEVQRCCSAEMRGPLTRNPLTCRVGLIMPGRYQRRILPSASVSTLGVKPSFPSAGGNISVKLASALSCWPEHREPFRRSSAM